MRANFHSIETFSSLDGPGIRYVLFLQGCNMNCLFCHNIDSVPITKNKVISVDEVVKDYLKYEQFYKNGGITISGGEPLLQIDFIIELFTELKKYNVHTCIETQGSLFRNNDKVKKLIELTDLFIVDIKGVDDEYAKSICGHRIENTFKFLKYLDDNNSRFLVTYVLLPGINDDEYCILKLAELLNSFKKINRSFKINPYRRLGVEKWENLGLDYKLHSLEEPTKKDVEDFIRKIKLAMLCNNSTEIETISI